VFNLSPRFGFFLQLLSNKLQHSTYQILNNSKKKKKKNKNESYNNPHQTPINFYHSRNKVKRIYIHTSPTTFAHPFASLFFLHTIFLSLHCSKNSPYKMMGIHLLILFSINCTRFTFHPQKWAPLS
jgi:hypothetical protein